MTKTAAERKPQIGTASRTASDNHTNAMRGLGRSPMVQAMANADNALRVLDLMPRAASPMCPHPADVLRAELENVRRYLAIAIAADSGA